ncbi:MAG: hypothetical protein LBF94_00550 [Puniceicoccales bacterium]|jgi:hypothetical protein|nr:hypothetical protein [Puniceicoccales bacterium]
MFPSVSVNPNVPHYSPSPLQGQVEKLEIWRQKIEEPIRKQMQEKWNGFQSEKQRMPGEEPWQYVIRLAAQDGEQLAQQLRLILEWAVRPMRPKMQKIHRRSIDTAGRFVMGLAIIVVEIIENETVQQAGQKVGDMKYKETQDLLQAQKAEEEAMLKTLEGLQPKRMEARQNMARLIWGLFGFAD